MICFGISGCSNPDVRSALETDSQLTVMSFNIRYDNPNDGIDAWPNRKEWVASIIDESGADIVGLQESLHHQIKDIVSKAPRFDWIGVGRTDGMLSGEFSPLLYDTTVVRVIDWETRWLSPTPSIVGSKGWDAAITRVATIASFLILETADTLHVVNTHFDHRGENARTNSAALIREWTLSPGVALGDFNFTDTSDGYARMVADAELRDAVEGVEHEVDADSMSTFRSFDPDSDVFRRIDYQFVARSIEVLSYKVLSPIKNGRYPSDHLPVVTTLRLK